MMKGGTFKGDAAVAKDLTPDLTEELYSAISPYLPVRPMYRPKGGRPFKDDKGALRGILYLLREGCKWQSIPSKSLPDCPSGSTCWRRLKEWTALGVWANAHVQLLDLLGEEGVLNLERVIADSASVRAQKGGRTPDVTPLTGPRKAANATS
jgi:transposase